VQPLDRVSSPPSRLLLPSCWCSVIHEPPRTGPCGRQGQRVRGGQVMQHASKGLTRARSGTASTKPASLGRTGFSPPPLRWAASHGTCRRCAEPRSATSRSRHDARGEDEGRARNRRRQGHLWRQASPLEEDLAALAQLAIRRPTVLGATPCSAPPTLPTYLARMVSVHSRPGDCSSQIVTMR
jgi:hypothetical protein